MKIANKERKIILQIYKEAKRLGACSLFSGKEQTIDEIVKLFLSVQGLNFCFEKKFPNPEIFRLFKPYGVEKYGIYIDAGEITLNNPKRAVLVGDTTATLNYDMLQGHHIEVFQGAKVTINASKWSVVFLRCVDKTKVTKNIKDSAKVYDDR